MLTGLVHGHVELEVGDEGGGDGGLDDGGAVDAYKPEERHSAVDDGEAQIAVCCGEKRLEHLDNALGEAEAKDVAERKIKAPEEDQADAKGDDVLEGLGDIGRHLLGHLDGDVALDKELVDDAGGERAYKGG